MAIEWRLFLVALGLLTRLPLQAPAQAREEWQRRSVRHNPGVGLMLGGLGAGVLWAAAYAWPATLAVMLGVAVPLLLTGARDEAACMRPGVQAQALVGVIGVLALKVAALHGLATRDLLAALALMPLAQAWAWAVSVLLVPDEVTGALDAAPQVPLDEAGTTPIYPSIAAPVDTPVTVPATTPMTTTSGLTRLVAGGWMLVSLLAALPFVPLRALFFAALATLSVAVWAVGRPQRGGPVVRLLVELVVYLAALALLAR